MVLKIMLKFCNLSQENSWKRNLDKAEHTYS